MNIPKNFEIRFDYYETYWNFICMKCESIHKIIRKNIGWHKKFKTKYPKEWYKNRKNFDSNEYGLIIVPGGLISDTKSYEFASICPITDDEFKIKQLLQ